MLRGELGAERFAFRRATRHERVERAAEHLRQRRPRDRRRRGLRLFRAHDARTLEHPRERHLFAQADGAAEGSGLLDILGGERGIDADLLGGLTGRRTDLHGDVDTSSLEARLDQPARVHLAGTEGARQAQRDVEVAVVDGARCDGHRESVTGALGPAESRHAAERRVRREAGGWHRVIIGRNCL